MRLQDRKHGEQVLDNIRHLTASATLTPNDTVVHVTNPAAAVVLTLPSVAEAAGKMITVRNISDTGSKGMDLIAGGDQLYAITEVDPSAGTTIDLGSAVAFDTAGDFITVYSNGFDWIVMAHRIQ